MTIIVLNRIKSPPDALSYQWRGTVVRTSCWVAWPASNCSPFIMRGPWDLRVMTHGDSFSHVGNFFSPEVCSALGRVLADPAWCHLYDSLILSRLSINYHYIWQGVINRPKCYVCAFFCLVALNPKTKIEKFPNQYFVCFAGQWWLQWTVKHQDGARWDGSTRFNEGRTGFFSSLF